MRTFVVDRKSGTGLFIAPHAADLFEHLHNPRHAAWIDFYQPDYDWLRKNFGLSHHLISICKANLKIPYCKKIGKAVLFKTIVINPSAPELIGEIKYIITARYVLTLHDGPIDAFVGLDADADAMAPHLAAGTAVFTGYLLDRLADCYLRVSAQQLHCCQKQKNIRGLSDTDLRNLSLLSTELMPYIDELRTALKALRRRLYAAKRPQDAAWFNLASYKTTAFCCNIQKLSDCIQIVRHQAMLREVLSDHPLIASLVNTMRVIAVSVIVVVLGMLALYVSAYFQTHPTLIQVCSALFLSAGIVTMIMFVTCFKGASRS